MLYRVHGEHGDGGHIFLENKTRFSRRGDVCVGGRTTIFLYVNIKLSLCRISTGAVPEKYRKIRDTESLIKKMTNLKITKNYNFYTLKMLFLLFFNLSVIFVFSGFNDIFPTFDNAKNAIFHACSLSEISRFFFFLNVINLLN